MTPMKSRVSEFASLRLTEKLRRDVLRMARDEKRSLSQMLGILVEEALIHRTAQAGHSSDREMVINQ